MQCFSIVTHSLALFKTGTSPRRGKSESNKAAREKAASPAHAGAGTNKVGITIHVQQQKNKQIVLSKLGQLLAHEFYCNCINVLLQLSEGITTFENTNGIFTSSSFLLSYGKLKILKRCKMFSTFYTFQLKNKRILTKWKIL